MVMIVKACDLIQHITYMRSVIIILKFNLDW